MPAVDIIKHSGQRPSESFDQAKLHQSVLAACLSVRTPEGEAEHIAKHVSRAVGQWCQQKPEVTSHDIRRVAADALNAFHPEASYLYKQHRVII